MRGQFAALPAITASENILFSDSIIGTIERFSAVWPLIVDEHSGHIFKGCLFNVWA
jgi:hypothetical protein